MRRGARRQQLELLMGLFGFFTVVAFVAAVVPIVRGEPSVAASLVLLGCLAGLVGSLTLHRRT